MPNKARGGDLVPADPLDRAVSIKATLHESGIEGKAQSRAIAALDSLVGSIFDASGGAWLDGLRRRQRARDAAKEQLIVEQGKADIADLRAARAAARVSRDAEAKQEAREAIAAEVVERLKALPPPKAGDTPDEEPDRVDPDWMNTFNAFAENATADRLRSLWARVLAGEVHAPGTFSRSTLRAISELDASVTRAFGEIVDVRLPSGWLVVDESGSMNNALNVLTDAGFVQPQTFMPDIRQDGGFGWWPEGLLGLRIREIPQKFGSMYFAHMMALSRTGREIAAIFPEPDLAVLLEKLAKSAEPHAEEIDLVRLIPQGDGISQVLPLKSLYKKAST